MTRQEIIDNAVMVQLPNKGRAYKEFGSKIVMLPTSKESTYNTWRTNEHHYTTKYHREVFLPSLLPLLGIDKLVLNEKFHLEHRMDRSGMYDISILHPNNEDEYTFTVVLPTDNGQKIENLSFNDLITRDSRVSDFHSLWYAPHKVSYVINETISSDKKLLISGDSQMIPSMAFLATLFKEIVYLDNRTKTSTKQLYESINYSDVLFELNFNDITKYTVENMR